MDFSQLEFNEIALVTDMGPLCLVLTERCEYPIKTFFGLGAPGVGKYDPLLMQYNSFRKMPPKKKDKKGEAEAKRWLLEYDDNDDRGDIDDDPLSKWSRT